MVQCKFDFYREKHLFRLSNKLRNENMITSIGNQLTAIVTK